MVVVPVAVVVPRPERLSNPRRAQCDVVLVDAGIGCASIVVVRSPFDEAAAYSFPFHLWVIRHPDSFFLVVKAHSKAVVCVQPLKGNALLVSCQRCAEDRRWDFAGLPDILRAAKLRFHL